MSAIFFPFLRRLGCLLVLLPVLGAAQAANGYITTHEAKLDLIFSQAGFGADTIDIRFNRDSVLFSPELLSIDSEAEWDLLMDLGSNLAGPVVNMYFVDKVLWCGSAGGWAGCAATGGNVQALNSGLAAHATLGGNLLGHELGHNLGLEHVAAGLANLMTPAITSSFALSAAQITAILGSGLVQSDATGRFITIQPIAVMVPEPAVWVLFLLGAAALAAVGRRRR